MSRIDPNSRPEYSHQEFALEVGGETFRFRTFSLYDLTSLWLALPIVISAFRLQALHLCSWEKLQILEHLCPELTKSPRFGAFDSSNAEALFTFYKATLDVERVKKVGQLIGEPSRLFLSDDFMNLVTRAALRELNVSVTDFVNHRFEYCADVILSMGPESPSGAIQSGSGDVQ